MSPDFSIVERFENRIVEFFGAPYGVAVDSATHGIELCLRYTESKIMFVPKRTYLSIPFLSQKLGLPLHWEDKNWKDYYFISNSIYDAAVLWKANSYIPTTFMCLSFQYQKHLSLGRGGMVLCNTKEDWLQLKKMSYDGRLPCVPWRDQDIDTIGYHYYMTPETAELGLMKLPEAIKTEPRQWTVEDWPDLTQMKVFKK